MVFPHTDPDHSEPKKSPKRRERYKGNQDQKSEAPKLATRNEDQQKNPHTSPEKGGGSGESKNQVDLPDELCRYLQLKFPEQWQSFIGFAKSYETFRKGLIRFMEILLSGDQQDRKIFSLLPLELLSQWDICLELENVSDEYTKKDNSSGLIILGDKSFPWRKVISEVNWARDPSITGMVRLKNIEKIKNPEERKLAESRKQEIEKHPIVLKALNMFSGEIIGYAENSETDESEL